MTSELLAARRREHYGDAGDGIFLNNASWGVSPRGSAEAMADFVRRRGRMDAIPDAEFGEVLDRARGAAARLLRVDAGEIALAPNTSFGINLAVALAAGGAPGRIVVSEGEFPANVLPWLTLEDRGFELDVVPAGPDGLPDAAGLEAAVRRPGAAALSLSAVQFATGYAADLDRMGAACRDAGVLFVVDGIQGAGVVPLHPREVGAHVVAVGAQKWLCGPWGSGFAWVAGEVHDRLPPPMVSWLAVEGGTDFSASDGYRLDWLDDARRYELATLGIQDHLGMAAAVELLLELGIGAIRDRIHGLHAPLLAWAGSRSDVRVITPVEADRRGGILALRVPDPEGVLAALQAAGVQAAVREGLLRLAPHWWVRDDEIGRVVEVMDAAVGG